MPKISNMARRSWLVGAVALLSASFLAIAPSQADTKKTVGSVSKMLKEAGFKAKQDGNGFTLLFTAKSGYEFPIIIACVDDTISMMAYIAPAAKITRSPELTAGLLEANTSFSFLKIIFDTKGNLMFKYDAFENMIDADDLKKLINMMVENTVNFYTNAPFIKK